MILTPKVAAMPRRTMVVTQPTSDAFRRKNPLRAIATGLLLIAGGCQHGKYCQGPCEDIAPGAIPRPAGTYTCAWQSTQAARAESDRLVIYYQEWFRDGAQLGEYGQQHLAELASELPFSTDIVIVESEFDAEQNSPRTELNAARVAEVQSRLAALGVVDAQNRVVLGRSNAEPLLGDDAARAGEARLRGTGRAGGGGGVGTSTSLFGGGFGGGGGGGVF